jgi:hypothetical protein
MVVMLCLLDRLKAKGLARLGTVASSRLDEFETVASSLR